MTILCIVTNVIYKVIMMIYMYTVLGEHIYASLLVSLCGGLPWGRTGLFSGFVGTTINPQMGSTVLETGFIRRNLIVISNFRVLCVSSGSVGGAGVHMSLFASQLDWFMC